ncbi:MAG TPA: GntR family transcriptional regulator [Thermomicrobiales bacterium]|nr:GntR family transcriptional regulator [Thermomicrobiales bacterium]
MKIDNATTARRQRGAAARVHHSLRRALLTAHYAPGERLVETHLAEQLGVSRTPVREALCMLEAEGLVAPAPAGGVLVRDIAAELVEIYGLRQRLEGYAAFLAARRITPDELAALDDARREALAALDDPNLDRRAALNNRFHLLLTAASHSPRLARLVNDYRDYFLNREFVRYYDRETGQRQHVQHLEIVEALRSRNAALAEHLVRDHFQRALDVIQRGMKGEAG